jgi:hypothetical protein
MARHSRLRPGSDRHQGVEFFILSVAGSAILVLGPMIFSAISERRRR